MIVRLMFVDKKPKFSILTSYYLSKALDISLTIMAFKRTTFLRFFSSRNFEDRYNICLIFLAWA